MTRKIFMICLAFLLTACAPVATIPPSPVPTVFATSTTLPPTSTPAPTETPRDVIVFSQETVNGVTMDVSTLNDQKIAVDSKYPGDFYKYSADTKTWDKIDTAFYTETNQAQLTRDQVQILSLAAKEAGQPLPFDARLALGSAEVDGNLDETILAAHREAFTAWYDFCRLNGISRTRMPDLWKWATISYIPTYQITGGQYPELNATGTMWDGSAGFQTSNPNYDLNNKDTYIPIVSGNKNYLVPSMNAKFIAWGDLGLLLYNDSDPEISVDIVMNINGVGESFVVNRMQFQPQSVSQGVWKFSEVDSTSSLVVNALLPQTFYHTFDEPDKEAHPISLALLEQFMKTYSVRFQVKSRGR